MAKGARSKSLANGTEAPPTVTKPIELAIALPHNPGTRIHLQLTISESTILLFLAHSSIDSAQSTAAMGSLVYAMPDRYNPTQPLSTPLYTLPSSVDFVTRLAKVLVRKTGRVCYVGGGINLSGAPQGGSVEEEMEAFRAVVGAVEKAVARPEQ